VEAGTGEGVEPLDVRKFRMVEHAGRGDHDIRVVDAARARLDAPAPVRELEARDLLVEADAGEHAVLARDALEVLADLGAGREAVAPLRIRLEGVAVDVGGHVAGEPRIGVLAPGSADAGALLVHDPVLVAGLAQADRTQHAGHAGADDGEAELSSGRHGSLVSSSSVRLLR
jgi:hypothetical protein